MKSLKEAIESQIKSAYNFENKDIKVNIEIDIRIVDNIKLVCPNDHIFEVVNQNKIGGVAAMGDVGGGMLIQIGSDHVESIVSGKNSRTIPHELGHTGMLAHPHADSKYKSINKNSDWIYEQSMTESERQNNLMSQGWYVQKAGKNLNESKQLTNGQIKYLYLNYLTNKLNKNVHVKSSRGIVPSYYYEKK